MGLEDVSKFPNLFAELIRRGYSDEDLQKIARLNIIRVFKGVEAVSMARITACPYMATVITSHGHTCWPPNYESCSHNHTGQRLPQE